MNLESRLAANNLPWVIFALDELKFAINSADVESMILTPDVAEPPNADPTLRGVFHFRNVPTPLIDLRMRLGMRSRSAEVMEFCKMLDAREQDHRNWLNELESSVRENRDFALTTDPNKCAFGKWYADYEPETHSMKTMLAKFDQPHRRIHALGETIIEMRRKGDAADALKLIDDCRATALADMIRLFEAVKKEYRDIHRETTIVFGKTGHLTAIAVDSILRVSMLDHCDPQAGRDEYMNITDNSVIHSLARLDRTGEVVFVINHELLM